MVYYSITALSGNYVNFGVFELYGDRALFDALDIALKMFLLIPLVDILAFQKLTGAYFAFLEVLLSNHLAFFLNQDTSTFLYVVGSLEAGLKGLNTNILSQILKTLFEVIVFEDSGSQWSLSRPMLSLILISEEPADHLQRLSLCFDMLMENVTRSLEPKNRDKFAQNLTRFKNEFRAR